MIEIIVIEVVYTHMQATRQHILDILNEYGPATVDELVERLCERRGAITAVTVRHHLARLQEEVYVTQSDARHRSTPGRPQHIYSLTHKAQEHLPNNFETLTHHLLAQIEQRFAGDGVNVIFEGMAGEMAQNAAIPQNLPMSKRLDHVVKYLNEQGYRAYWEPAETQPGYVLHTTNCPYHGVAQEHESLCQMDMRLITALVGVVPRQLSRVACGDASCAYLIPNTETDSPD